MTEKQIFDLLVSKGLTECGAAALMGHFQAESGMNPKNLENQYEKKLGHTDASYTAAVDSGTYTNFVRDSAGYGLVQWTYWSRKQNLLNFARSMGRSIGDMEMQVLFCIQELKEYKTVWQAVTTGTSIQTISDIILTQYERPANQSESVKKFRAGYGQEIYNRCAGKKGEAMTESQARQKIVDIITGWVGRSMKDGTHKPIIDIYNGHKPLARGYAVKYTDPYCAVTVSAAAIEAGYTDIIPTECGCPQMVELFKRLGRWQENDAYVPQIGDVIFYDWQDTGVGDNVGVPDHVGIVVSVSDLSIKAAEGNLNGAVGYRTLCVNGRYIRGYGVPDYAFKAGQATAPEPAAPSDTYTPYAAYQNGSTAEPVYSTTGASGTYIGSLDPYEKCECMGIVDGMAMVLYKVSRTGQKKIGFVKWLGGVKA